MFTFLKWLLCDFLYYMKLLSARWAISPMGWRRGTVKMVSSERAVMISKRKKWSMPAPERIPAGIKSRVTKHDIGAWRVCSDCPGVCKCIGNSFRIRSADKRNFFRSALICLSWLSCRLFNNQYFMARRIKNSAARQ